jgi:hypothetical protein
MTVTASVRTLPARVVPLPGESLVSLLRRTAAAMRYEGPQVFSPTVQFWTFWRHCCSKISRSVHGWRRIVYCFGTPRTGA